MTLIVEDGSGIFGDFSSRYAASVGSNSLTIEGHGLVTGYGPYLFAQGSGVLPGGITEGSFYWVIVVDADTIQLATTEAKALAETVDVTISSVGTDDATRLMEAANANSYITDVEFTEYLTARGNDYSAAPDAADREKHIILAMDYISVRWGNRFKGSRRYKEQFLDWPRVNVYDNRGTLVEDIPKKLKHAVIEYAFRSISASLLPDPVTDDSGMVLASKREKIGPIEEQVEYGGFQKIKPYPKADMYLLEYVTGPVGVIR